MGDQPVFFNNSGAFARSRFLGRLPADTGRRVRVVLVVQLGLRTLEERLTLM